MRCESVVLDDQPFFSPTIQYIQSIVDSQAQSEICDCAFLVRFGLTSRSPSLLRSFHVWAWEIKLFNYSPHLWPWSPVRFVWLPQRTRSEQTAAGRARKRRPTPLPDCSLWACVWLRGCRGKREHCLAFSRETELRCVQKTPAHCWDL